MPDIKRTAARRLEKEAARQAAFDRGETSITRLPNEGLSTGSILDATVAQVRAFAPALHGDYLDIGAGNGELIDRVMRAFPVAPRACDYRDDLMTVDGVKVDVVDLNVGSLPYPDALFELVTCTEVIEHLEHYRPLIREIFRILRPGGVFVVSTPNVLNLRTRVRYLLYGFFNVFGPLRLGDDRHHSTHGHINPVGYFYLAHALSTAGFTDVRVAVDRLQRRSWISLVLLWLPIRIFTAFSLSRERNKYRTLDAQNEPLVRAINRRDLLLGRTIVVGCRKPSR